MSGALLQSIANPPNPLVTLQQDAAGITAMRDYQAKQASGEAYQQAIDPKTGALDMGKYNALMASSPQGAWNIGPNMQQAGSAMTAQGVGSQEQVAAKLQQLQGIAGYMSPLFQKTLQGQPVSGAEVLSAADAAVKAGIATPEMAANIQKQVASLGPDGDASNLVRGAYFATGTGMQQLQAQMPNFVPTPTGSGTEFPQLSPLAPHYSGGAPVAGTDQVQIPFGTQMLSVPRYLVPGLLMNNPALREQLQQANPSLYQQLTAPSGGAGGGNGPPVTTQSFPNGGRYPPPASTPPTTSTPPPPPRATPVWAQPPPSPVQGGAAGGVGLTPAPGYLEGQKIPAAASSQALATLQAQAAATKDIQPILSDMQRLLGTKGFSTGMGSQISSSLRQLLQFAGATPSEPGPGLDVSTPQGAQEEFAKDSARLQAAQLGSMGNPTDARQELSEVTNPGMLVSKYGNQGIIQMLQGNQQAITAQMGAWQQASQAGWTPERYQEWLTTKFLAPDPATGGRFDPRVFWFANAPNLQEQRAYAAKVPAGTQRTQFLKNLQYAKNNGWIGQQSDGTTVVSEP